MSVSSDINRRHGLIKNSWISGSYSLSICLFYLQIFQGNKLLFVENINRKSELYIPLSNWFIWMQTFISCLNNIWAVFLCLLHIYNYFDISFILIELVELFPALIKIVFKLLNMGNFNTLAAACLDSSYWHLFLHLIFRPTSQDWNMHQ